MFIFSIPDSLPHKELIWVLDIKKHYYHIAWRNIDATYMKCTHQAKLHKQKVGLWLCRTVNFFIEVVKNCGDWQLMSVWFWTCVLEGGWWKYPEMKLVMLVSHLLYPPPPPPLQPHRFACGTGYVYRYWHSSLTGLHSELFRGDTQMFIHLISHRAGGWPVIFSLTPSAGGDCEWLLLPS